ncbi:DUF58 domain-containing protein [Candidatus Enterococcus clewellii]|uniref:DUF58 domain-containing protein n=1 Tax=Candidatus Enterococcus clewellii TaxID=1834193 RepID=A0A242K215_9ENTE|nr:DUF58 domain-containing protein [Enterococcus sp. 9E7_DIV0242]OTP11701.1 hypothetical protein A5888_003800 [Enterococcus sp. 9E7_DIV0242]
MNRQLLKNSLRMLFVLFFYLVLFLYTVIFNNASGWTLFFFLTFLLVGNLISLLPSHKKIQLVLLESSTYQAGHPSQLTVEMFTYRPLLLPLFALTLRLHSTSKTNPAFFWAYTGNRKILSFHWTPETRGLFSELPVFFHSTDFLQLLSKGSIQALAGPFSVLPKLEKERANAVIQKIVTVQPNFYASFGNRTFTIRDFRSHQTGDPLRLIDWKQSSKRNELIVKEYEQEQEQEACLIFYGQKHARFEELLSVYYSMMHLLDGKISYTTKLLADYPVETLNENLFAVLQPFSEEPYMPTYSNKKLLIFAPEPTERLQNHLKALGRTNEVFLITFDADQLCLQWKEQVFYITPMEVTE